MVLIIIPVYSLHMNTTLLHKRLAEKRWDTETLAGRCMTATKYMDQVLKGLTPSKRLILLMARELELEPHQISPALFPKPSTGGRKAASGE
jgi:hypothetical protein